MAALLLVPHVGIHWWLCDSAGWSTPSTGAIPTSNTSHNPPLDVPTQRKARWCSFPLANDVGDDCPVPHSLFGYYSISAGDSMEGAARLSRDKCDMAIYWAVGQQHAKKSRACCFCCANGMLSKILGVRVIDYP
ncbi:hypothetical protein EDC04DRAFT_2606304 [Pisolithus marmoratus]|nr:hypothetical protein EDC04DRAFT_2606304 [Pisolithus marmoratus]